MFTKMIGLVILLTLGGFASIELPAWMNYSNEKLGATVVVAQAEFADTFACPTADAVFGYASSVGFSDCSLISWMDVQVSESLGLFPIFADYIDEEGEFTDVSEEMMAEVFRVNYDGVQMFAIKGPFPDEHMLDLPFGRLPGTAYTLWEDGVI